MAATFGVSNTHGLQPDEGHVSESSKESSCEVATIMDETGATVYAGPRKLVTSTVTISGKGSVDLEGVTGGNVTAGQTLITSIKQSESNDDFPDFEIQGTIYTNTSD
jgi:phage gp45-like